MNTQLYETLIAKKHRSLRREVPEIAAQYASAGLCANERMTRRFEWLCSLQTPTFLGNEKICFLRTTKNIPDIFTQEEWEEIREKHYIHESGYPSNVTVNYANILNNGLLSQKKENDEYGCRMVDSLLNLVKRYQEHLFLLELFQNA